MFLKILLDGMIIDVISNPQYVRYQVRNHLVLLSDKAEAFGILSSDRKTIFHLKELQEMPEAFDYPTVTAVEITKEEYEELRKQLETDGEIENIEPDEKTEPEQPPETVMSPTDMRLKIKELTETVETLAQKNAMLEECLLEMSEVVYA